MATDKPRFTITIDNETLDRVSEYKRKQRISTQSKAIVSLVQSALTDLEAEGRLPKIKTAPSISDEAMGIAKRYDALDSHGKEMVSLAVDCEIKRMEAARKPVPAEEPTKVIPLIGNSFAAGRGDPDFGNPWEDYKVPADSKAEFAVRINGDSMEPYLPDGSIALGIKRAPRDGEVAALLLDGEFLCKQVCQDFAGNLYLFALNRARKDADQQIRHDEERSVSCFGTILMERVPLPND